MFFHGAKSCRGLAVGDGERKRSRQAHFVRAVRGFCGSANVSLFFTIFLERPTRQRPLLSSATHLFDVPGGRGGARLRAWRNCQRPISFCFSSRPVAGRIAGMKAHLSRVNAIRLIVLVAAGVFGASAAQGSPPPVFLGNHYRGTGQIEHVRLLEVARRMFEPDPELQNLSMLYEPKWKVRRGAEWDAGGSRIRMEPLTATFPFSGAVVTFLQNSLDSGSTKWRRQTRGSATPSMGGAGRLPMRRGAPGWIVYKQGDGRTVFTIGAWNYGGGIAPADEFPCRRDSAPRQVFAEARALCRFIESRRDPTNNLFLAGRPGISWRRATRGGGNRGSYGKAILAVECDVPGRARPPDRG